MRWSATVTTKRTLLREVKRVRNVAPTKVYLGEAARFSTRNAFPYRVA